MQFFDFDFDDALNGGGYFPAKLDIYQNGKEFDVLIKSIDFPLPQMGMFHTLNIIKLPDGTLWLDFLSSKYAPNTQLMQFMKYCTDEWGLDSKQQGYPTQKDTEFLRRGYFGRYWSNVKITQCKFDNQPSLTITLRIIIDNQDMSNFTKQLAKGFIRSAVNQVGRDGGRVISNNLYNGENYIPISNTTGSIKHPSSGLAANQSTVPQESVSTTKHFTAGKMALLSFLSIFLMPLGPMGVILYGVFLLVDRSDKVEWYTTEPSYTKDLRYKTGARYIGDITQRHSAKVQASPEVMNIKKRNAKIAIIIGGVGLVLFAVIMIFGK